MSTTLSKKRPADGFEKPETFYGQIHKRLSGSVEDENNPPHKIKLQSVIRIANRHYNINSLIYSC